MHTMIDQKIMDMVFQIGEKDKLLQKQLYNAIVPVTDRLKQFETKIDLKIKSIDELVF